MASITVTVVGQADLERRLASLGASGDAPLRAAVEAAALLVQNAAKQKAPRRTSTLRRSITFEVAREGGQMVARIGPTVTYGRYVEFGTGIYAEGGNGRQTHWVVKGPGGKFFTTRGMKPQPYMRPALDENREKAIREIARVYKALLARQGG